MTLTPNRRYGAAFEADASGLRLVAEKPDWKTIFVSAVTLGSPSSDAGMEPGDILQKVNGKVPPPLYELDKLLVLPGTSITITILRSGKQKMMTIHLRRLV
jgi:S1-C subfamily serine protease